MPKFPNKANPAQVTEIKRINAHSLAPDRRRYASRATGPAQPLASTGMKQVCALRLCHPSRHRFGTSTCMTAP